MFIIKKLLLLSIMMLLLTTLIPATVFASEITPMATTSGRIWYSPSSTSKNKTVSLNSNLTYTAIFGVSYEYYSEIAAGNLSAPKITSTSFNPSEYYQTYNSYLLGPAWVMSGSVWVVGSNSHYLYAQTQASSSGSYPAKVGGGPGYLPSAYPYTAMLHVN